MVHCSKNEQQHLDRHRGSPLDLATSTAPHVSKPRLCLGIDMGGSQTRWAALMADGDARNGSEEKQEQQEQQQKSYVIAEGVTHGSTALHLQNPEVQGSLLSLFTEIARQLWAQVPLDNEAGTDASALHICAGITGLLGADQQLIVRQLLQQAFACPLEHIRANNDIEIAYYNAFEAGAGYLIYAGTGSIGAFIDRDQQLHRVGGHGYILDDAGGGYWIAREALKHIWRREDEQPGCWQQSTMAQAVFEQIGGHDWASSRQFLYQGSRGQVGRLALAVAACADEDRDAAGILQRAGMELARLADLLTRRFGRRDLALAGRIRELHPIIARSFEQHLPAETTVHYPSNAAHHAAAHLALRDAFL